MRGEVVRGEVKKHVARDLDVKKYVGLEEDVNQSYYGANRINATLDTIIARLRHGSEIGQASGEKEAMSGLVERASLTRATQSDIENKLRELSSILFGD